MRFYAHNASPSARYSYVLKVNALTDPQDPPKVRVRVRHAPHGGWDTGWTNV